MASSTSEQEQQEQKGLTEAAEGSRVLIIMREQSHRASESALNWPSRAGMRSRDWRQGGMPMDRGYERCWSSRTGPTRPVAMWSTRTRTSRASCSRD